ncbi:MAG: hypothetical protein JWN33_614 [Candidatus Saccharibacteria bacterium]|nr:hypothetical protein [Candidatus Saccharibacteria bacterium]
MLADMLLPSGFEPDFQEGPDRRYAIKHTLLGKSGVDVYPVTYRGKSIEWHVAHDQDGRVWLERLKFSTSDVTSYGTDADVILAGALNAKPLDYAECTEGTIGRDYDNFDELYVDLRKTFDRMPWVRRFRAATGVR